MAEKVAHLLKKIALALFYILIYFALLKLLTLQVGYMEEDMENYSSVITIIASIAALGIFAVMLYLRRIRLRKYIKYRSVSFIDAVLSFTMAIGFRLLTGAYLMWAEDNVEFLQRSIEGAQQSYNFNTMTTFCIITAVLSVSIVAPFFEEVLFRGIVQKELSDAMGIYWAIILQGVLFGLAHAALAQSIFTAIYGIILGVIYYKTKNILIVMLSHMFFNISSVLEIKNVDALGSMVLTGLLLTAASIYIFFYIYRRKPDANTLRVTGGNNDD